MESNKIKDGRTQEIIRDLASMFLARESNGTSLITITKVNFNFGENKAVIFFTVLPEEMEEQALAFAKRKRSEFREYVKMKSKIPRLPNFDFNIDLGEKNRQKIEEISRK